MNVPAMLKAALGQLERERTRIDRQIASLQIALNGAAPRLTAKTTASKTRRRMSTAARQAVSRRMKAYWAKRRAAKG